MKKCLMAACMSVIFLTGITGCTKETEALQMTQEESEERSDRIMLKEKGNEADSAKAQENSDNSDDKETMQAEQSSNSDSEKAQENSDSEAGKERDEEAVHEKREGYKLSKEAGTEFLPGKVQSVEADSMVVAQTTVMGDGEDASSVTLVDEKDARKITVKFTADTKVEHWIIQGGGAGIDMQDASISDLKPGIGVEIEGYYEGDAFVAVKILIEEYK